MTIVVNHMPPLAVKFAMGKERAMEAQKSTLKRMHEECRSAPGAREDKSDSTMIECYLK